MIDEVASEQADREVERKGPRVDAPEKAREGFLRSLGDADYRLDEVEEKKGRFLVARFTEKGKGTRALLEEELPGVLARAPSPNRCAMASRTCAGCGRCRALSPFLAARR
ncbi:MAG: glycine--tRNA ligase subunit beta [Geminicoccaceae bacterium]